jgi:hypothetical protein
VVNALSGERSVVLQQLVAEERRGVVATQVEVTQVGELVAEAAGRVRR